MPASGSFARLLDLAKEPSSEKRRELLREITNAFLDDEGARTESEGKLFDEIFAAVASDLKAQVRAELSHRIAHSKAPLHRTARRLALDEIAVAQPIIEKSRHLSEMDLLDVIREKGQDHMMAVSRRAGIGERVSSALVERGEDPVVVSLLSNPTARLDRATFERVADRAANSPVLHAPFVRNRHVPLDLLNEVYLSVEASLRAEIMRKFQGVAPGEVEAALEASRNRLSAAYGALPPDFEAASAHIEDLRRRNLLKPQILVELWRENRRTAFTIAFASLTGIEFNVARRLVGAADLDAIAVLARAAGFDRALFISLCLVIDGESQGGLSRADRFRQIYDEVPPAAAQRALRFWRVRESSSHKAA
jgi:uncharacterized protein (DUF2336 family)